MNMSGIFARGVALIGAVAILLRHGRDVPKEPAYGSAPSIPAAKPQGIPTLKRPTARGWVSGQTPTAAAHRCGDKATHSVESRIPRPPLWLIGDTGQDHVKHCGSHAADHQYQ